MNGLLSIMTLHNVSVRSVERIEREWQQTLTQKREPEKDALEK